ncbi:NAD(P)/FAD-dependent oxidoreductase [Pseudotamlana agarivorans]|uniref:NAD(P)/FAD-dependent oxidoreductase n=1 Tax=Pseudotamlana agarivorans TaxID=481183 RepID=UPI000A9D1EF4|nr:NAD(P)/FAD-dependent oxidoreductase [Tamlana agarivorans]
MTRRELIKYLGTTGLVLSLPIPISSFTKYNIMTDNKSFDAIIIGGSYAGLSAAMALGRSLRNVLIIDAGDPCNKQTPHSHNFITQDGINPKQISELAKEQVLKYNTVKFLNDFAISGKKNSSGFTIKTKSRKEVSSQKLIFATGVKDIMPSIKGFSDCWGISIVHCPYCHGYEIREKKTAIYADIPKAMHLAPLVKNLTDDLTLIIPNKSDLKQEEIQKLKKHNIAVVDTQITEIEHQKGSLKNIVFSDGKKLPFEALYAAIPFKQHSSIPEKLGCKLTEHGHIEIDLFQKTTIDSVYACGDNSGMMRSVANAVYSGNITGAMVNAELAKEQF